MSRSPAKRAWTQRQTKKLEVPGYRPTTGKPFLEDPVVTKVMAGRSPRDYALSLLLGRAGYDPTAGRALLHVVARGYASLNTSPALPERLAIDQQGAGSISTQVVLHVLAALYYELTEAVQQSLDAEVTDFRGRGAGRAQDLYLDSGVFKDDGFWPGLITMALRAREYQQVLEFGSPITKRQRRLLKVDGKPERPEREGELDHHAEAFQDYRRFVEQCGDALFDANLGLMGAPKDPGEGANGQPADLTGMRRLVHRTLLFRCQDGDWPDQLGYLSPGKVDHRLACYLLRRVAAIDILDVPANGPGRTELERLRAEAKAKTVQDANGLISLLLWSRGFELRGMAYRPNSISAFVSATARELSRLGLPTTWIWNRDVPRAAEEWMP
jgi:hypothetical protein